MAASALKQEEDYPQSQQWDYIATPEEREELEKLLAIRKAIKQSKAEFERGEGIPATPEFFADIKQKARAEFLASKK